MPEILLKVWTNTSLPLHTKPVNVPYEMFPSDEDFYLKDVHAAFDVMKNYRGCTYAEIYWLGDNDDLLMFKYGKSRHSANMLCLYDFDAVESKGTNTMGCALERRKG